MDPRIARTRLALQRAMLELASEQELDEITVGDIVLRAGVNRSSYYHHYADRDTLLADAIDVEMHDSGALLQEVLRGSETDPPAALRCYLSHFETQAAIYARVFGERGSLAAQARFRDRLQAAAVEGIRRSGTTAFGSVPDEIAAAAIAGSVTATLGAWVSLNPRPDADTAVMWIWQVLVGPGMVSM